MIIGILENYSIKHNANKFSLIYIPNDEKYERTKTKI
jgi:hypothetical protein